MRLAGKGRHTGGPVGFWFNGTHYNGIGGDTLASALLANGVTTMGWTPTQHRPLGVMTAGVDEVHARVNIGKGDAKRLNVNAATLPIYDGLVAHSIVSNAGIKSFTSFLSPLMAKAPELPPENGAQQDFELISDRAWAFCDVLVIGAGPAGLMAALTAAEAGADVLVVDADTDFGGRLLSDAEHIESQSAHLWAQSTVERLAGMDNVRMMLRTSVQDVQDQGVYTAVERLHDDPRIAHRQTMWRIVAKGSVLCTGSYERPILFPNNDRPGIMLASAMRSYLHRYGVAPGKRLTVFANNDAAHQTAHDFADAGVHIAAIIDPRKGVQAGDIPVYHGAVTNTAGRNVLKSITVTHAKGQRDIVTDCLAVSGGWNPALSVSGQFGAAPEWHAETHSFCPAAGSVPGMVAAGAARGVFDTFGCLQDGVLSANEVLVDIGLDMPDITAPSAQETPYSLHPLWLVEEKGPKWGGPKGDLSFDEIEPKHRKEILADPRLSGVETTWSDDEDVARALLTAMPTPFGAETVQPDAVDIGPDAQAPIRTLPSNDACAALGAPLGRYGDWLRPSYLPFEGEDTPLAACAREVAMVRSAVGVSDVSYQTMIDVQGADAAVFLDFVCATTVSETQTRRIHPTLLLNEDGTLMDSANITRLDEAHFVVRATTASDADMMRHLDFAAQVLCPDLDVQLANITESSARFVVAGPLTRDLVNKVIDAPINDVLLPYLGARKASIGGTACRLARVSSTGEYACEIAVSVAFGEKLFVYLARAAASLEGGVFGADAANVLRIEKGILAARDMGGIVTPYDLGIARQMDASKDYIGRARVLRPDLNDARRAQLVGLKGVPNAGPLPASGVLYVRGGDRSPETVQGRVTSTCHSPSRGREIGLGFLTQGRARYGDKLVMVDPQTGTEADVDAGYHVFYDHKGEVPRG